MLILGGGFGGVYAARVLDRALRGGVRLAGVGRRALAADVTLVSRENYLLFTPLLHEVAAGDVEVTHVADPLRRLLRRVRCVVGAVTAVDLPGKRVTVTTAEGAGETLGYDYLVLALGAVPNFRGSAEVAAAAHTMQSLGDALRLRTTLIDRLEALDARARGGGPVPPGFLDVVVAGGGLAGVETAGAVSDLLREAARAYPAAAPDAGPPLRPTVTVVEHGPRVLAEMHPRLSAYAERTLRAHGVAVRCGVGVRGAAGGAVSLDDGTVLPAATLVWTAGTAPNPVLAALPCATDRGRVVVNAFLEVPDWPGVWAVGDAAAVPAAGASGPAPATAQFALREGTTAGRNVVAALAGGRRRAFAYRDLGRLAAVGRRRAVAHVLGADVAGFGAWLFWRAVYLAKLPRLEKRVRVGLDWVLDLAFPKDLVAVTARERAVGFSGGRVGAGAAAVPATDDGSAPAGARSPHA